MEHLTEQNSFTKVCPPVAFLAKGGLRFSHDKPTNVIENPVEYNGVLNDNQPKHSAFLLTLDWLQIHYKVHITKDDFGEDNLLEVGEVRLRALETPTQHFLELCEVHIGQHYLGMLQIDPRKGGKSYSGQSASLKINNRLFYESNHLWFDLVCIFEANTRAKFQNITRLDIALDTPNTDVFDFVNRWVAFPQLSSVRKKGRARFIPMMTDVTNERSSFMTSFKVGVPASSKTKADKILTCYNKTEELKNGKKPYIEEYFYSNFGSTDTVTRYEFRFSSRKLKQYKINSHSRICYRTGVIDDVTRPLCLEDLTSTIYIAEIYKIALQNFFEFVPNYGDKNISRRPVVKLFDFDKLIKEPLFASKREKGRDDGTHMAKIMVKRMLTDFVLDNLTEKEQHNILGSCSVYIQFYKIQGWLSHRFGSWRDEWDKQLFLLDKELPNYPTIISWLLPELDLDATTSVINKPAPF